jgi:hypothetical protein
MLVMRTFTDQTYRLQSNTLAEVKQAWDMLEARYKSKFRLRGKVLRGGPMLSAVALHFVLLPDSERRAILERSLAELERLMEGDEDVPGFTARVLGTAGDVPKKATPTKRHEAPAAQTKKRRRSSGA